MSMCSFFVGQSSFSHVWTTFTGLLTFVGGPARAKCSTFARRAKCHFLPVKSASSQKALQDLRVRPRTASVRSPSTSLVFASTRLLVFIMSPLGVQDGPCRRNRKLDAHLQCTMRGTHNQARILLPWVSSRPVHCMQRHRKSNTVSVVYGTFPTNAK